MGDEADTRTRLVTVHKECPPWLRGAIYAALLDRDLTVTVVGAAEIVHSKK